MACEHTYVFLRQEERNVGYDRNPTYYVYDIYYCQRCCTYKRIHVRTDEPDRYVLAGRGCHMARVLTV